VSRGRDGCDAAPEPVRPMLLRIRNDADRLVMLWAARVLLGEALTRATFGNWSLAGEADRLLDELEQGLPVVTVGAGIADPIRALLGDRPASSVCPAARERQAWWPRGCVRGHHTWWSPGRRV
jgi:hypothetical protein